ncbi:MAG: nucleotidyltransferase [Acidaminobacter sp.]|uniref:nucleotidyltransferase substrate binding protein n=1 Tax=Acidaminobacter sp. TaxID=1872102 RepID=UPI00137CC168|nr:nucleotidyltransferase substrate binding protein [Acidaminobacter sp.]MZQ99049.1 nucleotidyltransferase [Acidaminobacter sp.]
MDVRWHQRFDNYRKALSQLNEAIEIMNAKQLSNLEKQGVIQSFEYTHELAWKTLKDFLLSRGTVDLFGSRDVVRESFQLGLIENGEIWMEMIKSRNLTSHTYNEATADEIITLIHDHYFSEFVLLKDKLLSQQEKESE